ncbi:MAG: PIG-L family deacetylase [Chloroflexi bacterium]|nr:PIG-L family deacetylase [Chloroflexota bacterium]
MRVLSVSAHPDDDTLFAGGMLAKLAGEGHEVYSLLTTRGEGGEVGEPPVGPKEQLGQLRELEARAAARELGERDIFFLDFVDPHMEIDGIALPIDATLEEFSRAVSAHLERLRPEVVLTHGQDGEYGHPQHKFTHQAVRAAIRSLAPWRPAQFVTWVARTEQNAGERLTNDSDPADKIFDTGQWWERKVAAAMAHRSQHAMFLRNSKQPSVPDMVRKVESYRHWRPEEL